MTHLQVVTNRIRKSSASWRYLFLATAVVGLTGTLNMRANADRIVLAPRGLVSSAGTAKVEFAAMCDAPRSNIGWLNVGVPDDSLGLELEVEHDGFPARHRSTFSGQYSLTGNALSDIAPAISVGVRDAANCGREGLAFFLAMTKTMGLSEQQELLIRDWELHLGYGTSHMDGAYTGVQAKFRGGFTASAEYYARHCNVGVSWPLIKQLELKFYSLNGDAYYGAAFSVSR